MASSQHYQQYEVLTHVNENTMTTRPMRVSRNRENLQPYWIPEGFRAVLISINDIQRLPLQQATQDLQQRQNENTTHHVIRRRYANHNQTNPMARQGRCNTATVLGATLDQITVARAISSKPKRKELSGNENDENSQKNTPTASASASASTSIGSPVVAAQAKKRCLGNNKRIDARQLHHNQNQRAAINSRNNENKTPEHNISDPFGNYVATTTNTIAQTPSHNQRVSQRMSLSQQAVGSSNEFKHPRKTMALERDALYAMHGSNRVSKNTSSMHINKPFRVSTSRVESTVLPHHLHSNPLAEDNSGLSNEGRNNGNEEMESVELDRDQAMKM
ncbi:4778_t:CDS:1 [Paraglomus brasilianum]|uniref:4778_t:CDS:1 n=1 Tax=Paraglomus brasilianum TaxID=144538 RepID=A0A9N9ANB9_9GLOM|nr:4778_t:CDS:1 [Paraglomus brasilianum]